VKHTYTTGGSFSVVLTVTGEAGLSSSKTNAVAVEGPPNVAPTATFTWTPQAPAEKVEVTFTSTVTDSDQPAGTAFTYAWNFGDTATSALANPKHTFAEKKSYTVKLTVTDARSAAVTVEHTISVGNTLPVVATLTASNVSPNTGDVVTFTATATDADSDTIAKYTWNFGDGTAVQTTTTGTTTHTYAAPGTRTMSVTATDSRGAVSVAKTLSITVAGPDRILLIIYPNPAKTQATVRCILPSGVTEPVLVIYSLGGDIVLRQELTAGQVYIWNLLDAAGNKVGNGLYFCVVTATAAGGGSVRSDVFRLLVVR
jgi:PKD repeat protein